jgi:hypothetical protein
LRQCADIEISRGAGIDRGDVFDVVIWLGTPLVIARIVLGGWVEDSVDRWLAASGVKEGRVFRAEKTREPFRSNIQETYSNLRHAPESGIGVVDPIFWTRKRAFLR